jgi:hypothetical protein
MKRILKIDFCDFWGDFDKSNNLFLMLLQPFYEVIISEKPDVLFYSCFGFDHLKYNCYKIFYTGENVRPNFMECDFSLSFDHDDYENRNLRVPFFRWQNLENFGEKPSPEEIKATKKKFCCMVVSNSSGDERNEFFRRLSTYKKIDSGGNYLNNIGHVVENKMRFIKEYKFVISFENSCYPGYTTEKIIHPMGYNCLPVYWGNPLISRDFNTKSFINIHDYKSQDAAIEEIIRIDNNVEVYDEYLSQPWFEKKRIQEPLQLEYHSNRLFAAIENFNSADPVSKKYINRVYEQLNKQKKLLLSRVYKKAPWYY